ncbi:unnamed protein product, partial [Ectocarpus fasciculatus]
ITHITDIEGNGEKFIKSITASRDISLHGSGKDLSLRFSPSAHSSSQFVYGGDVADKGPFSLRLLRLLVDFKKREPERVHLIVGNREAKMTRITEEIPGGGARERLLQSPPVFWNKLTPPIVFVEARNPSISPSEYIYSLSDADCEVLYLRWMLSETMGCGPIKRGGRDDTFDMLRLEIAEINGVPTDKVEDTRVLDTLKAELQENGAYFEYLTRGVLMHRIGENLFLHGAVTSRNIGAVPGRAAPVDTLDEWINALNLWYRDQTSRWASGETKLESPSSTPGCTDLMSYMVHNPMSVVTTNWYSADRKIVPVADDVVQYLMKAGVRRALTGHQPFSDFPLVLQHPSNFQVIVGDTSYSDESHSRNNQGCAYHILEIIPRQHDLSLFADSNLTTK